MEESKKKRKRSKKNEVSDTRICEAEQGGNEGCKRLENDERSDMEKKKQKKKREREDSNMGILGSNKANIKGEFQEFAGAEDGNRNVDKKIEKKKKKKRKKDKTVGGSIHRLEENHFEDAEGVGKKKRKRENNKGGLDKGASQHDSTQLTESGKQDRENRNGEHLGKSDQGCERKIIKKAEKKKRNIEKGKEMDGSAAARARILAKENNRGRADATGNEQENNNVKNGKNEDKSKKVISAENGSQDSKPEKCPRKVRFSANMVVSYPSDVVGSVTERNKDRLLRGKRFSKEEDEIVKLAVYNYIAENCLGDKGLKMVLNCRSHPKIRNCWKEIGAAIPYRPYTAVYSRAHILFQRSENRKWTEEETKMVRKFYEQHGPKWKEMAEELGKHRRQVLDAWRRIKVANLKKGRWSQQEYQMLFELVNMDLRMKYSQEKKSKYGMLRDNIPWGAISEKLSTRSHSTCCLKWYCQLTSPMVAQGKWSDADDYRLINALYQLDESCIEDVNWDNLFDHRSGDVCRKRWNQMAAHIGQHGTEYFAEQVELLAMRYCPDLLDARVAWDDKSVVL